MSDFNFDKFVSENQIEPTESELEQVAIGLAQEEIVKGWHLAIESGNGGEALRALIPIINWMSYEPYPIANIIRLQAMCIAMRLKLNDKGEVKA